MSDWTTQTIDLPTGARLEVAEAGDPNGETVIAIHGLLGTARMHLEDVINWLAGAGYHVYGPSLRGYGGSTPRPRGFPLDFYQKDARDVIALLDALAIDRAHVVGYSDGGEVALLVAGMAPDRVITTASWGSIGYYGEKMRPVIQRMFPATWITDEEKQMHGIDNPDGFVLEWMQTVRGIIDAGGDLSVSLAANIRTPLLMMLGTEDTLNPPDYAQRVIDQVNAANPTRPDLARLEMFACGHAVHELQPEAFRAAVGAHLRQR